MKIKAKRYPFGRVGFESRMKRPGTDMWLSTFGGLENEYTLHTNGAHLLIVEIEGTPDFGKKPFNEDFINNLTGGLK